MTRGKYAKEIIINEMKNIEKEIKKEELILKLNKLLKTKYFEQFNEIITEELLRAYIIIYSNYYKEIWVFGDCQCLINNKLFDNSKK